MGNGKIKKIQKRCAWPIYQNDKCKCKCNFSTIQFTDFLLIFKKTTERCIELRSAVNHQGIEGPGWIKHLSPASSLNALVKNKGISKNVFQRQEKIKMWGTGPKLNLRDRNLNTKALLVAKFWWKLSGTLLQFQEKEEREK